MIGLLIGNTGLLARAGEDVSVVGLVREARAAMATTNLAPALDLATQALHLDPAYGEAWKQYGRILMLMHRTQEALQSFHTAQPLLEQDTDVTTWRKHLLVDLGRYRQLADQLEHMPEVELATQDPGLMARVLGTLLDQDDRPAAQRLAARWARVAPRPEDRTAAAALGQILRQELREAEKTLQALPPQADRIHLLAALAGDDLGRAYLAGHEHQAAVNAFQFSLGHRPDGLSALRDLGWAYRELGQPEQAIATWQRGVDLYPSALEWSAWMADTQLEQGQADRAEKSADRLLAVQPEHARARALKLAALLLQHQPAATAFEQELAADAAGRQAIILGHARAERVSGRFEEAADRLSAYLRDHPADSAIRETLLATLRDWAATAPRNQAEIPLQRLLVLDPRHAGAQRDLGWLRWGRGEREEGLALLDQSIRNGVANRDEVIAQAYAALAEIGQGERAAGYLKQWAPGTSMHDLGRRLFKQGRLAAAEPALELAWLAWANAEAPRDIGLRLAFLRALKGQGEGLATYLDVRAPGFLETLDDESLDLCLETLTLSADQPDAFALMQVVEQKTGGRRTYVDQVTRALEIAADRSRQQQDYSQALRLYRRVLDRDGDRLCYLRAADCAEALGRRDVAINLMESVARRATSEAARHGATGKRAEYRGELARAVAAYQKSLQAAPDQADVRQALFGVLVKLGRLSEARAQAAWFVQKYESGAHTLRSTLAEMWSMLGDDEAALAFWKELATAHPGIPYYTIEQARACFRLGRPDEAQDLLHALLARQEEVRAWQLLAELHSALGHHDRVLVDTERGLAIEVTRDLLRLRAEAAEALNRPAVANEAALALLQDDPGNGAMARTVLRSWQDLAQGDKARAYAESLVGRNPANLPALVALYRIAVRDNRPDEATRLAGLIFQQRPWDPEATRRYGAALAGQRRSGKALDVLRPQVEREPGPALVALLYRTITTGPYPARLTAERIAEHIRSLAEAGYRFLTPDQWNPERRPETPSVMLFVADTDHAGLQAVDEALATYGARATYAGFTTRDARARPGQPTPAQLQDLVKRGRWMLASSGPLDRNRIPVDARGTLGQPLIQRGWQAQEQRVENDEELQGRLEEMLDDMAAPLPATNRVLLYPQGDYGHLALDNDAETMKVVRQSVGRHFKLAFAADDAGFINGRMDPLRLPIRSIPADWSGRQLVTYLATANPAVALQLLQAKVLYGDRQHDEANTWFAIALAHGASPTEVKYHWGANAFHQGDLPTSESLLAEALAMQPGDARIRQALVRTQAATEPRLNIFGLHTEDNEDRRTVQFGNWARGNFTRTLRPEALLDFNRWTRPGGLEAEGWRYGAGTRWFVQPQTWVDGRLWYLDYTDPAGHDFWGGFLRMRVPNPRGNGDLNLEATRDEVGTVEAIQRAIEQWTYAIRMSTRLFNQADFAAHASYEDRDDVNDTRTVDGRLLWRVRENPYLGVGVYGQMADSGKDPAEYDAPMELHQYQLMAQWQGTRGGLNYQASAQAGYARAQYRDWRFAWASRVWLEYAIWRQLYVFGDLNYLDTVGYQRWQTLGGVSTRF